MDRASRYHACHLYNMQRRAPQVYNNSHAYKAVKTLRYLNYPGSQLYKYLQRRP